jgi:HEAT repeat protein
MCGYVSVEDSDRNKVRALLEQMNQLAELGDYSAMLDLQRELGPERFARALEWCVRGLTGKVGLLACMFLLSCIPKSRAATLAIDHLHHALYQGDRECRTAAVQWLAMTEVTRRSAVGELEKYLSEEEDTLKCWAANAICLAMQSGDVEDEDCVVLNKALDVLGLALNSNSFVGVMLAARTFGRLRVRQEDTFKVLKELFLSTRGEEKALVAGALGRVKHAGAVPLLESILSSTEAESELKAYAAIALGEISTGQDAAEAALVAAVACDDCNVAFVAASALHKRDNRLGVPKEAVDHLIEHLDSPVAEMRQSAAMLLGSIGAVARPAVPKLLRMLEEESDDQVCLAVVGALSAAGKDALPGLIEMLQGENLRTRSLLQQTLLGMGETAAGEVALTMMTANSLMARRAAAWLLASLGPKAAEAVPVLLPLLDSEDNELVTDTIVAFGNIGRAAKDCTQKLAKFLWNSDETIRGWAAQAIYSIGPEAVPELQKMRSAADADHREKLDDVIANLSALFTVPMSGFKGITDMDALELFRIVGDLLLEHGRMSHNELARAIVELQAAGDVDLNLSASPRQIGTTIKFLEEKLSEADGAPVVLVNRKKRVKGGLTAIGQAAHEQITEFLQRYRAGRDKRITG